jgi:hypothetical protein
MTEPVAGTIVSVLASEPWDFVSDMPENPFPAVVESLSSPEGQTPAILLKTMRPFVLNGRTFEWFVARRRHEEPLSGLRGWTECVYNVTVIGRDQANSSNPWDLRQWRGGGAFMATLARSP